MRDVRDGKPLKRGRFVHASQSCERTRHFEVAAQAADRHGLGPVRGFYVVDLLDDHNHAGCCLGVCALVRGACFYHSGGGNCSDHVSCVPCICRGTSTEALRVVPGTGRWMRGFFYQPFAACPDLEIGLPRELAGTPDDAVDHVSCQPAGECVLLTGMIGPQECAGANCNLG